MTVEYTTARLFADLVTFLAARVTFTGSSATHVESSLTAGSAKFIGTVDRFDKVSYDNVSPFVSQKADRGTDYHLASADRWVLWTDGSDWLLGPVGGTIGIGRITVKSFATDADVKIALYGTYIDYGPRETSPGDIALWDCDAYTSGAVVHVPRFLGVRNVGLGTIYTAPLDVYSDNFLYCPWGYNGMYFDSGTYLKIGSLLITV